MRPIYDSRSELNELVNEVTSSLAGVTASPSECETCMAHARWFGCVGLSGAFEGSVVVGCSPELPRRVARYLFGEDGEESAGDALAELANVLAGNLKALLPGDQESPLHLSAPRVEHAQPETGTMERLVQASFRCDQDILTLELYGRAEAEVTP
jgi:CheY-specific phosphatase CheX